MARTDNLGNFLTDIAESIREKKGTTEKISASDFDTEIAKLEIGSAEANLQSKEVEPKITEQIVKPDGNFDGLSEVLIKAVTSSIDPNILGTNIREGVSILGVDGMLNVENVPEGAVDITKNGTYDISSYATANVKVPTEGGNLPENVFSLTSGSFVVDTDLSSNYVVEHNLGEKPNFFLVYSNTIASSTDWINYLYAQLCLGSIFYTGSTRRRNFVMSYIGKSDGTGFTTSSVVSGSPPNCTDNTFTMNITSNRKLKAHSTYYWICGKIKGLEQVE